MPPTWQTLATHQKINCQKYATNLTNFGNPSINCQKIVLFLKCKQNYYFFDWLIDWLIDWLTNRFYAIKLIANFCMIYTEICYAVVSWVWPNESIQAPCKHKHGLTLRLRKTWCTSALNTIIVTRYMSWLTGATLFM